MNFLHLNIITLLITHFLWGFVNTVYIVQIQPLLLSIYGTTVEAAQILGFILSIGTLSAILPLIFSFFADTYGRRRIIILGESISIIGLIGLSFGDSKILVTIISIIFFNTGVGFYDPPLQGIIFESSNNKRRGLAYSIVYNSSSVAGIIASFLIQIEVYGDLIAYFQISCFLFFLAIIFNLVLLRDILPNKDQIYFPLAKILKKPLSRLTAIAFALDSFFWSLPLAISNGIYIILFEVDVSYIATINLVFTLLLVIFQYPAGMVVDRFGRFLGLIAGELMGILWIFMVIYAILIDTPDIAQEIIVLAYAALGISVAFWRPSVTISFIEIDPSAASTNFGILAFIQRLGVVPTAAIAGFVFSLAGFLPLLFVTFFGTLVVISIFIKIDRLEKTLSDISMSEKNYINLTSDDCK